MPLTYFSYLISCNYIFQLTLFQLHHQWRRRREVLHLGLEEYEDGRQVEGARQLLHLSPLAPARDQQGRNRRLGRTCQTLGLKNY